ncbi:Haloacid dehalogenase-like hydrolase domain-containing protein Sgpp [Glycine soja]
MNWPLKLFKGKGGCVDVGYPSQVKSGQSSLTSLAPLEVVFFALHYYAFREMLLEIGFNGVVLISEEFFIEIVVSKHNDDIALVLFPGDLERGLKFSNDTNAMKPLTEAPGMNNTMEVPRPPNTTVSIFEFGSVVASNNQVTLTGYCLVFKDLKPCH